MKVLKLNIFYSFGCFFNYVKGFWVKKEKKLSVFYIQEILVSYRKPLIDMLSSEYDLTILSGNSDDRSGFKTIHPSNAALINCPCFYFFSKRVFFQKNILKNILIKKPKIILTSASTRNITYWMMLFLCKLLGIKVFSHGQGLYSKPQPSIAVMFLYKCISLMTYRYICYTYESKKALLNMGFDFNKVLVAENSINFSTDAGHINKSGNENGILYLGRIREKCELEKLILAVEMLRTRNKSIVLHVVGSGDKEGYYREKYSFDWLFFYGAIYDESEIVKISRDCRYGCYPGDVGLSIVHYFSLKLPPVIHGNKIEHGPEASYVIDGFNGLIFNKYEGFTSVFEVLDRAWNLNEKEYIILSDNAYYKYEELNRPPLEVRILEIMNNI